jgi:hypothetical protein
MSDSQPAGNLKEIWSWLRRIGRPWRLNSFINQCLENQLGQGVPRHRERSYINRDSAHASVKARRQCTSREDLGLGSAAIRKSGATTETPPNLELRRAADEGNFEWVQGGSRRLRC